MSQKPRRAWSEDWNHFNWPLSRTCRSARRVALACQTEPVKRRHSVQWQATTSRIGPLIEYRTEPHMQRLVA